MKTLFLLFLAVPVFAQHDHHHHHGGASPVDALLAQQASGTSLQPTSAPMQMMMFSPGNWSVMVHGVAFINSVDETGARGGDDEFSTNWLMVSGTHKLGRGTLMLRTMLSAEPWTIDDREYPLLFQTGETAFGRPIIDGQHPHDLFMELALEYAMQTGAGVSFAYLAKHGDPALGPTAFPHRTSASEIPQAVLAHHYQDSTHIATNVITLGYKRGQFMIEGSGFHGAEPDEDRADLEDGSIDSASVRFTWTPTPNLVAQVSTGHLEKPEALEPGNSKRTTASVSYDAVLRPWLRWSATGSYGKVTKQSHRSKLDSYLAESLFQVASRNWISMRVERNEKDELFPHPHPANRPDFGPPVPVFTVNSFLVGYTFDVWRRAPVHVGVGANATFYNFPERLDGFYGESPVSRAVYVRLRLAGG